MYEDFGGVVDQQDKTVTFKLFLPDGERSPYQYEGGGLPRIREVGVTGSFQDPQNKGWNSDAPEKMTRSDFVDPRDNLFKGYVYSYTSPALPDGFYEYKYVVTFDNGTRRFITDPCGRYGGTKDQNSAFVVGGRVEEVKPLKSGRLPYKDLIIYEMMIDDFTANIRNADESPLQCITSKLDYLKDLGINAIEFMPWTAWTYPDDPDSDFSWGYNPVQYFSVAHKYTLDPSDETNKIIYLKDLINACHDRDIHVIMDGVFNHADAAPPDLGFPYYWLYEDTADSPYVGNFAQAAFFRDLDFANRCTLEYIRDSCIYWIEKFKVDGIRFDNTLGMYIPGDRGKGIPKLLSELRAHLAATKNENFAMILEHSWDYGAIDVANKVGATSCWLDPYRSTSMRYLGDRPQGIPQIEPPLMRMLDSGRDFGERRTPTIYIENHDHLRFMLKAGGRDYWHLTQPYIIALFSCSGAPLIYNGQEFGQDNDMPEEGEGRVVPRPLKWDYLDDETGRKVFDIYKKLIDIRKGHPGLHSSNFHPRGWQDGWALPDGDGYGIYRNRNVAVYHRWGEDETGRAELFYVVLNFSGMDQGVTFTVPDDGPWQELLSGNPATGVNRKLSVEVGSNWGAIYYKKY